MSDYIERLRGELLRAEAAPRRRRVRVPRLVPAAAALAAVIAVLAIALPRGANDEREATGPTATYRVSSDAAETADVLRERLRAVGIAGEVVVEGDSVTLPEAPRGLLAPGVLAVYDAARGERDRPALDNAAVAAAKASEDPMAGEPVVLIELTADGERRFEALTRALARRGADLRELQHLAITVDDRLYSKPYIDWRQTPDGIDGAQGMHISDRFTRQQATELAAVLDSGPLPGELR
jgi:hypothetical protein